jgi:hypothetical protein
MDVYKAYWDTTANLWVWRLGATYSLGRSPAVKVLIADQPAQSIKGALII